jgi:4-hydroxy-tetrahydrodipicolinate synthase
MTCDLNGLIPPIVLPMRPGEEIDHDSLGRQTTSLLDAGARGFWVNGTTGEFHSLSAEERVSVVSNVVERADGRGHVVAQVGAPSTREAVRHACAAVDAGADYIAAVAPFYLAFDHRELTTYYRAISAAIGAPILVYQLPQMTKVGLTVAGVVDLASEGAVCGIKDSSGDLAWLRNLIDTARERNIELSVFSGGGATIDASLLVGARGAMCAIANLMPHHCAKLIRHAGRGDWEGAASLQKEINVVNRALTLPGRTNWAATVAVYKYVLTRQGLIDGDTCASPLAPLDADERARIDADAIVHIDRLEATAKASGEPTEETA